MNGFTRSGRRGFLKAVSAGAGVAQAGATADGSTSPRTGAAAPPGTAGSIAYPRVFKGRQLAMLAFPLGGVAAGSVSLGGRGQLRDWEMFNRPNKGYIPT